MTQKHPFRTVLTLAASALVCLGVIAWPSRGSAAGDDPADLKLKAMVESMHQAFASFINTVNGLSVEEQDKVDDLEVSVARDLKAHPEKMDHPAALRKEVLAKFRDALSPNHQKKYDELMADIYRKRDAQTTSEHLKQIGVAAMLYSRDHGDAMPPDLATLVSKSLGSEIFLAGGATTQPSSDPKEQDVQHQAKWVTQNAEFIYMAAGKNFSQLPDSFVVAYVKPAAAKDGNTFLLDDGSVVKLTPEQAVGVVAELQSGKNPPPSLKKIAPQK